MSAWPSISLERLFAYACSLGLHSGLLVTVAFSSHGSSNPEGLRRKGSGAVVEIVDFQPTKKAPTKTPSPALGDVAVKEKSEPRVDDKKDRVEPTGDGKLGFQDGVAGNGELGDPDGVRATERQRYLYELTVLLNQRKSYPVVSQRMGESGQVVVRFLVHANGEIRDPQIIKASAFERLNRAALELVNRAGRFKPLPTSILASATEPKLIVEVPIDYELK